MANKQPQGRFLKKNVKKRTGQHQPVQQPAPRPAPAAVQKKPVKAASISKTVIVFTVLTLCISILASVFFLTKLGISFKLPSNHIAAGVTVAGVDVGGLSRKEAVEAVTAEIGDSYTSQSLVVTVLDKTFEIAPHVSCANLDVEAAVERAFEYGTLANPAKQVDIIPYLGMNTAAIQAQIQAFGANFPTEGSPSSYEVVKETIGEEEQVLLNITVGSVYYDFDADALYEVIEKAYNNHSFATAYSCNLLSGEAIDLDAIYEETCIEPVDAQWDSETNQVIASSVGYRFDLEAAKTALESAQPGDVLQFPYEMIQPEIDTDSVTDGMFRDELGTYTAKSGSSYNRDTNLRLACEALDGTILYPGDVFSYNEALGERTPEKGYLPADSYMGSQTIKSYGGGICQPSSSLYYCALLADLEIVERSNHGFVSSYMPYGMDATVDWSGPDFKFRNSTNYPIRIDAEANGGTVTVTLMGTDEKDYYVKMEYEILGTSSPKTIEEKVSASSGYKDGQVKTTPYTGYTVQTYKLKYNKDTDELISREKEAYSQYSKRDKVVYKVVDEEPEETEPTTTPTEPTTTPTEPTTTPTEPTTTPTEPTTEPTTAPTDPPATDPPATDPPESGGGIGEATG